MVQAGAKRAPRGRQALGVGGGHESPSGLRKGLPGRGDNSDKGLEMRNTRWVLLVAELGWVQSEAGRVQNVRVSDGAPLGPHSWSPSSPLEGGAALGPLTQSKTPGQVELILEIFIDQVKFTVTLKYMRIFLGEKKEIKNNR